jgi:hypothetical protein
MVKRVVSAALWFLAVGSAFEYVTMITGLSSIVGVVVAASVSAFFGLDPLHVIWTKRDESPASRLAAPGTSPAPAQRAVHSGG